MTDSERLYRTRMSADIVAALPDWSAEHPMHRSSPPRSLLWLLPLVAVVFASVAGALTPGEFSVRLINDRSFASRDVLSKKPILLKFWATWCVACLEEMPAYRELHERIGDRVAFLAVNVAINDPLETVQAAAREHRLAMPVGYDRTGALWQQFGVIGTPMYVLIGKNGGVVYRGYRHDEKLERALQDALGARNPTPSGNARSAPQSNQPLLDIDGQPVSLNPDPGETVVVYRFATWCESYVRESRPEVASRCRSFREELARLAMLQLPNTRFVGFATRYSTTVESVRKYRDLHHIAHPLVFDEAEAFTERFGARDFPHLVVVRDGAVVHSSNRAGSELVRLLCGASAQDGCRPADHNVSQRR